MAQFAVDSFTNSDGTLLSSHDANWVQHGSAGTTAQIASNRVRGTASGAALYYHSGVPNSADYSVTADIYEHSDSTSYPASVLGRMSTSANTFYMARHDGGANWQLYKFVAGSATQLGSNVVDSITTGTSVNILLKMVGTTIELFKRGEGTPVISVTDSAISVAGKSGIRMGTSGSPTPTNTTLYHLDNFSADDISSGDPEGSLTGGKLIRGGLLQHGVLVGR